MVSSNILGTKKTKFFKILRYINTLKPHPITCEGSLFTAYTGHSHVKSCTARSRNLDLLLNNLKKINTVKHTANNNILVLAHVSTEYSQTT